MALSCRGGAVHSITTGLMHRSKHEVGPSPRSVSLDLSVECPFNKFYGINCRPKLGAKLLDRFFHRRRQVSPPANNLTHRFFDGSQHVLCCNFTVGSRHSVLASYSSFHSPLAWARSKVNTPSRWLGRSSTS